MAQIQLREVTRTFGRRAQESRGEKKPEETDHAEAESISALDRVTLTVPDGKATVVIGGNYAVVAGDPEVHVHFDILILCRRRIRIWGAGLTRRMGRGRLGRCCRLSSRRCLSLSVRWVGIWGR